MEFKRRKLDEITLIATIEKSDNVHVQIRIVEDDRGYRALDIRNYVCKEDGEWELMGGVTLPPKQALHLVKLLNDRQNDIMTGLYPR